MSLLEQRNKFKPMTILLRTFLVCCLLSSPQILCAAASGFVIGWGENVGGQATGLPSVPFSNGTYKPSATGCVQFANQILSNTVAVSAGSGYSLAIRRDGTVVGWGGNGLGGLSLGYETTYPEATNGVVKVKGQTLSNVVSIVASREFSLALKKDGTIVTWGKNYVPVGLTNILAIAAEWGCSWALKSDGTVVGWASEPSRHDYGQLLTISSLSNVVAIAVGPGGYSTRGVALRSDGTVGIWGGESIYKDATSPANLSNVVAIAAGDGHTLALKNDGTIMGWGFNKVGQATGIPTTNSPNYAAGPVTIGGHILSNVVSIAAGRGYSLALKKDGSVIAWGRRMVNDLYPVTVPSGLSNVVAIAAGDNFCLAITTNSAVADRFRH